MSVMAEREGVARLTRVARVAPPQKSTGMMPPIRSAGGGTRSSSPPAPPRSAVEPPTGVATLTPRARAAEAAARELRQVMGRFATGVTVITTATYSRPPTTHPPTIHGMTANAFLSVSLRPPLVLVSLGRCRMSEMLPRTGRYGVSVLASDQEQFAAHFAGQRVSDVPPSFIWENEFPLLDGALAHVGCRVVDVHTAGDHVLWIGEVEHLAHRDAEPLLFYTGRFGTLAEVSDRARG